jgi:hypothetical protein
MHEKFEYIHRTVHRQIWRIAQLMHTRGGIAQLRHIFDDALIVLDKGTRLSVHTHTDTRTCKETNTNTHTHTHTHTKYRNVYIALFTGLVVGGTLIASFNPVTGFMTAADFMYDALEDADMGLLLFTWFLSGMVSMLACGGLFGSCPCGMRLDRDACPWCLLV